MNLYLYKRHNGFLSYCVAKSYADAEELLKGIAFSKLISLELVKEDIEIQSV